MLFKGRDLAGYCLKCYSHHRNYWDILNLSATTGCSCDMQWSQQGCMGLVQAPNWQQRLCHGGLNTKQGGGKNMWVLASIALTSLVQTDNTNSVSESRELELWPRQGTAVVLSGLTLQTGILWGCSESGGVCLALLIAELGTHKCAPVLIQHSV